MVKEPPLEPPDCDWDDEWCDECDEYQADCGCEGDEPDWEEVQRGRDESRRDYAAEWGGMDVTWGAGR